MAYLIAILLLVATPASAQQVAGIEPLLAKIAAYEHGQSREPLARFTLLVERSLRSPARMKEIEERLLKFLQSDATPAGKDFALRELSLIATPASVPLLSGMLARTETAEMARYALARIPDPAADDALRAALAKTSGSVRIGIVNSVGERRDAKSVAALRPLLFSEERELAEAAAAALGNIADEAALAALAQARAKTTGPLRQRLTEAYIHCASHQNKSSAVKVYKELAGSQESEQIRIAALGGLADEDAAAAVPVLTAALDTGSPAVRAAAIRLLSAIPGPEITALLVARFPKLPPPTQARLLVALADRGDASATPLFSTAARNSTGDVRTAALSGLGRLGDASSVAILADAAASGQGAEQAPARAALYGLRGPGIDQAIVSALASATGRLKVELITAAGERGIAEAGDLLTQAVQQKDPDVRREAFRALRNVAGSTQVSALLELLVQSTTTADQREAMQTVASALKRSEPARVDAVVSAYKSANTTEIRAALLEVMGQTSSEQARPVLRGALKDPTPEIARAAILALSEWANPAPLPDLLSIARNQPNPALQVLALRGYLKLIGLPSPRPAAESARMLSEAMQLARQPAEKRTVLSLLPAFPSAESLQVAEAAMKDQEVAKEAQAAVQRINSLLKFK
jgi:HEAT repeat protein